MRLLSRAPGDGSKALPRFRVSRSIDERSGDRAQKRSLKKSQNSLYILPLLETITAQGPMLGL